MDISRLCKNQKATRKAKVYMPISIKFFDAAAIICCNTSLFTHNYHHKKKFRIKYCEPLKKQLPQ